MGSKFFDTYQAKANASKKSTTKWADESEQFDRPLSPLSQSYMHNVGQYDEHNAGSDEDNAELSMTRLTSSSFRPSSKPDLSSSSSVFANRPIGALLRSTGRKDAKIPTFKPSALPIKSKTLEQQLSSSDSSTVLSKLLSMESKIITLIENKMASIDKRMEASDKRLQMLETRVISTIKAVENITTAVEAQVVSGIKASRGDLEYVMGLINDCTKENGSALSLCIEEMGEKISSATNHTTIDVVDKDLQIGNDEVIVISANNPHDTVHKASADELMSIVGDNTIYVCSSMNELKRDLHMIREADFIEAQDTMTEEK